MTSSQSRWPRLETFAVPAPEIVAGRIGYIHDLFMTLDYEVVDELPDVRRDLVVLIDKQDRSAKFQRLAGQRGNVVVVAAPGDAPTRQAYLPQYTGLPHNFVAAFVGNNQIPDGRITNVPLGVRINKVRALEFVRQNGPREKTGLLYGNFALTENHYRPTKDGQPHIRYRLANRYADAGWATLDVASKQRNEQRDLIRYYGEIARHRFVLSPEGNGIDCYRHWECLYLGAIPIVMVSAPMTAFAELPILYTEDYSEVDEEYLETAWARLSRQQFSLATLRKSHYQQRFLRAIERLDNPLFLCWGFEDEANVRFRDYVAGTAPSPFEDDYAVPSPPFVPPITNGEGTWEVIGDCLFDAMGHEVRFISGTDHGGSVRTRFRSFPGAQFRVSGELSMNEPLNRVSVGVLTANGSGVVGSFKPAATGTSRFSFTAETPEHEAILAFQVGDGRPGKSFSVRQLDVEAIV